ncbi:MAG: CopG family ribbon-helix-helix protein [Candidatus Nanohalobium sp.]
MSSTRVNFRLPDELVKKADVAAEVTHRNRTEIVREALKDYLEDVEEDEKFREKVTELYLEDRINFEVMKEFIGWRDAEAVRSSKEILDSREEAAEEMADL